MSLPVLERSLELERLPPLPRLSRGFTSYSKSWVALLVAWALAGFLGSLLAGSLIGYGHRNITVPLPRLFAYNVVFVLIWLFVFERLGLYRRSAALTAKDELYFTVAALVIGVIPQLVLFTIVPSISSSRLVLLYALAFSIVGAGVMRTVLHMAGRHGALRRSRRVAIVGSQERIEQVRASMDLPLETTLLAAVHDIDDERFTFTNDGSPGSSPWLDRAVAFRCETVVLADIPPPEQIPHLLEAAAARQMRIAFAPPRIRRHSYALALEIDGQQALIIPLPLKACTPRARLAKRLMDVALGSLALLIFAPVMAVCAAGILIESGHPIFYRQQRVGLHGRVFEILKFRSMRVDAEATTGAIWAREGDDRCTRWGRIMRRFSLDELPQLFNVLRGDMSLVGPRPERPIFVDAFRAQYPRYEERHLVRPGLSGFSQMQMRRVLSTGDVAQKLTFDLYYLEEWSLFLDLSLLIRTVAEFLFQRAA